MWLVSQPVKDQPNIRDWTKTELRFKTLAGDCLQQLSIVHVGGDNQQVPQGDKGNLNALGQADMRMEGGGQNGRESNQHQKQNTPITMFNKSRHDCGQTEQKHPACQNHMGGVVMLMTMMGVNQSGQEGHYHRKSQTVDQTNRRR